MKGAAAAVGFLFAPIAHIRRLRGENEKERSREEKNDSSSLKVTSQYCSGQSYCIHNRKLRETIITIVKA